MTNEKKTPKTVSLSIPKGFEEEVAYLALQSNKSQYIWNLVREDMKRQAEDTQIVELVRQAMDNLALGGSVNHSKQPIQNVNNLGEDKRKLGALSIFQD